MATKLISTLKHRLELLQAENEYLLARAAMAGRTTDERSDCSPAANALVTFALDGPEPDLTSYPASLDELAICCRAWMRAPEHLRLPMSPLLMRFFEHAERRWADSPAWERLPLLAQVRGYLDAARQSRVRAA